jgi:hypothetical protein
MKGVPEEEGWRAFSATTILVEGVPLAHLIETVSTISRSYVVCVELIAQEYYGGDAADHTRYFSRLVFCKRTAENIFLTVREPFFDYLISTDVILPSCLRHCAPTSLAIEVHVYSAADQCKRVR